MRTIGLLIGLVPVLVSGQQIDVRNQSEAGDPMNIVEFCARPTDAKGRGPVMHSSSSADTVASFSRSVMDRRPTRARYFPSTESFNRKTLPTQASDALAFGMIGGTITLPVEAYGRHFDSLASAPYRRPLRSSRAHREVRADSRLRDDLEITTVRVGPVGATTAVVPVDLARRTRIRARDAAVRATTNASSSSAVALVPVLTYATPVPPRKQDAAARLGYPP